MFRKLLLITLVTMALAAPAAAAPAPQNAAAADTLAPALVTGSIGLDKAKGPFTVDGCQNYAIQVLSKMHAENIQLGGGNTIFGVSPLNGHRYIVSIRCELDNFLISMAVAGVDLKDAEAVINRLDGAWSGP